MSTLSFLSSSGASLEQVEESSSLSQLIRANASHYWTWAKAQSELTAPTDLKFFDAWFKYEGFVMGDPHIGNFSVIESRLNSDELKLVYRPVDFDDVGKGPFIVDLARLVVASKAVDPEIKTNTIVKSYIKGLENKTQPEIPSRVLRALNLSKKELNQKDNQEVESHTKGNRFEFKNDKLVKLQNLDFVSAVLRLYPEANILSMGQRILKRGGSLDAERLWVLIEVGGVKKIIEFKEMLFSSVSGFKSQVSPKLMIKPIFNYFIPNLAASEHLVLGYGENIFLMREKKANLVDTSFNISKSDDQKEFKVLSKMTAFHLGLVHGRQKESQAFKAEIDALGEKNFRDAVKFLSTPYLESVQKDLMTINVNLK